MKSLQAGIQRYAVVSLTMTLMLGGSHLSATIFGSVRGVVHDAQHKPVASAIVVLKTMAADWSQKQETTQDGEFVTDVQRGTLAVVSGQIAKRSPEAMKVTTPTTILGVRGTTFAIKVSD